LALFQPSGLNAKGLTSYQPSILAPGRIGRSSHHDRVRGNVWRMARAVIFDMDGVIVDSEPSHERAFLEVVREIGYGDSHGLHFADYVGRSDQELWLDFLARNPAPHSMEELLARKSRRMVAIMRAEQPVFRGLPKLVEQLAARYALGLASGSDRSIVEEVLRLGALGRFFSAVVTASEVMHGKPAPDVFLRTATLLEIAPADCWVIEDSKPGVAAGLAAGMRVIAITNTHRASDLRLATHVVSTYPEIAQLLL
jgi:beta-phosphoglucomutase